MKKKKIDKEPSERTIIQLKVEFQFAHFSNVQAVAMALAQSGYFVNIRNDGGTYILKVYMYPRC